MAGQRHGLAELAEGCYAYLQPGGGCGDSNAGLVVDAGRSLLVDTLFDLRRTAAMLAQMRAAVSDARHIEALVNTSADGEHSFGNQLVAGARIVASRRAVEEMRGLTPAAFAAGAPAEFFRRHCADVDLTGVVRRLPGETYSGELELHVGECNVRLIEVGPAHTRGDTLVHVPAQGVLYGGEVIVHGSHPIVWAGTVSHWIAACDRVLALDVETIIPGHGPIAGRGAVHEQRAYFVHLLEAVRGRFEAGMDPVAAAREIARERHVDWGRPERVIVNVHAIYRELRGESPAADRAGAYAEMVAFEDEEHRQARPGDALP